MVSKTVDCPQSGFHSETTSLVYVSLKIETTSSESAVGAAGAPVGAVASSSV